MSKLEFGVFMSNALVTVQSLYYSNNKNWMNQAWRFSKVPII